jgi:hypothetical protein
MNNLNFKQFYAEYSLWEDYNHGMYNVSDKEKDLDMIDKAKKLLCNPKMFMTVCYDVLKYWDIATKVNLTNVHSNRRAWLGQAACSYFHNVPEILTRQAWGQMNDNERNEANKVADKIIKIFEDNYERKDKKLYQKMDNYSLFE